MGQLRALFKVLEVTTYTTGDTFVVKLEPVRPGKGPDIEVVFFEQGSPNERPKIGAIIMLDLQEVM